MLIQNNNLFLLKLLIGFRTGFISLLLNVFNNCVARVFILNSFNVQVELHIKYIYPFLFFCKNHSLLLFNILIDMFCFEFLGDKFGFVVVYTLLNVQYNLRLFVKLKCKELTTRLLSISSIFYTACWSEREVFDFFGLFFIFNKDLRRILLDYGFQGYPLRKDFPLSGFIDIYYDDTIKKICYDKITLSQEYRLFFTPKTY